MDDAITVVLESWQIEWRTTLDLSSGSSKYAVKKNKEVAKLKMEQLAERWRKQAKDKAKAERATKKQAEGEEEEEERDSDRS